VTEAFPPAPARMLRREITPVEAEDTPRQALRAFRRQQVAELPVTSMGALVGWLREEEAAEVALEDADRAGTLAIRALMTPVPAVITPEMRGDELLAYFHATGNSLLPVVTPDGRYLGCVARVDALAAAREGWFPPPRIGGMATPLGVYLTTGTVSGGVGTLGLMLTGMVFAVMMWAVQHALQFSAVLIARLTGLKPIVDLALMLEQGSIRGSGVYLLLLVILYTFLSFGIFLLLLRFLPRLAGYHAAEHQTVNAIEAGEPLSPSSVARMPRVHPRCGTNVVAIASLAYLGVVAVIMLLTQFGIDLVVMMAVFGILFVAAAWKRIGGWLQEHLTTRPASAKELASGVTAGRELLRRHLETPVAPRRALRLWRMGFVQVLIGVTIMSALLEWLDLLWRNLVQ
jgi:CBS domain-containing protein